MLLIAMNVPHQNIPDNFPLDSFILCLLYIILGLILQWISSRTYPAHRVFSHSDSCRQILQGLSTHLPSPRMTVPVRLPLLWAIDLGKLLRAYWQLNQTTGVAYFLGRNTLRILYSNLLLGPTPSSASWAFNLHSSHGPESHQISLQLTIGCYAVKPCGAKPMSICNTASVDKREQGPSIDQVQNTLWISGWGCRPEFSVCSFLAGKSQVC